MELPYYLKIASEKLIEGMNISKMSSNAKELSRRYMEESGQGKSLLNRDEEAAVYSLMRMPATFSAVSFALEQVCEISDFVPRTLLDAGAGTGGASFAANEFFALDKITCLERELAMENIKTLNQITEKYLSELFCKSYCRPFSPLPSIPI